MINVSDGNPLGIEATKQSSQRRGGGAVAAEITKERRNMQTINTTNSTLSTGSHDGGKAREKDMATSSFVPSTNSSYQVHIMKKVLHEIIFTKSLGDPRADCGTRAHALLEYQYKVRAQTKRSLQR